MKYARTLFQHQMLLFICSIQIHSYFLFKWFMKVFNIKTDVAWLHCGTETCFSNIKEYIHPPPYVKEHTVLVHSDWPHSFNHRNHPYSPFTYGSKREREDEGLFFLGNLRKWTRILSIHRHRIPNGAYILKSYFRNRTSKEKICPERCNNKYIG